MTVENFFATLDGFYSRVPFQVFTVELNTGKRFEIDHPRALTFRGGVAVFLSPGNIPIFFDHESVSRITAAPADATA